MSKNKIIKKQWKRIEKLVIELGNRNEDIKNLIENPEGVESIQAKFNYNTRKQFDNFNLVAGRQPDQNKTSGNIYGDLAEKEVSLFKVPNDNVVAKGMSFGTFSGEECKYKFPKEELDSREYHVSKHAPVNMIDDKRFYGVVDDKHTEKNYLSEKEMIFDLPSGVEGWRSFIINGILIHAPNNKSPEDWTRVIETLKNLPVCKINKEEKPNEFIVEKDVKLGDNYIGDVKFQKSELLDKPIDDKKGSIDFFDKMYKMSTDVNKDSVTGNTPVYSPEHLEAKNKLFNSYADEQSNERKKHEQEMDKIRSTTVDNPDQWDDRLEMQKEYNQLHDEKLTKKHTDFAIEAGTHKAPDKFIKVLVKEGSIIIAPDVKGITMVKGMPTPNIIRVGDLGKCIDQECKAPKKD